MPEFDTHRFGSSPIQVLKSAISATLGREHPVHGLARVRALSALTSGSTIWADFTGAPKPTKSRSETLIIAKLRQGLCASRITALVSLFGIIGVFLGCGGSTSPTAPSTPSPPTPAPSTPAPAPAPPPPPTSFTVSGTVQRPAPYRTRPRPVPDVTVEVVDGASAGQQVTTDTRGSYSIANLEGTVTLRFSKTGYITRTKEVSATRDRTVDKLLGYVWPKVILRVMGRMSVVHGLLFIRSPVPGPSFYVDGVAVLRDLDPVHGEINTIAHERCHAHQDVNGNIGSWGSSAEGQDFIQTTGWRREGAAWIEPPNPSWSGYRNPMEDAALNRTGFLGDRIR